MREWAESLPQSLSPETRELFDLELRYSYVYCIAPSARAPHMTAYGRLLIFEHAIAYLDCAYEMAMDPSAIPALHTYHNALRVYFMGSQFVAVLRDAGDMLLSGGTPNVQRPLAIPGQAPPPPIPDRRRSDLQAGGDNLDRSLRSLERVGLTLQRYGERWEDALSLKMTFEMMSDEVMKNLHARRSHRDVQHHMQPMMGQPQAWVDINVSQMPLGPGPSM
jgi:hypothetical protein